MGLIDLDESEDSSSASTSFAVDLVFVHGLQESGMKAWTDAQTGVLWIRDLFPHARYKARRLIYEYDAERLMGHGGRAEESILDEAMSLVTHLVADRELQDAVARPIVFICHEFGGLLVKRALAYSHSRSSPNIEHVRYIFRSTFAILFMSTPHQGFGKEALMLSRGYGSQGPNHFALSLMENSEVIQEITDQFAPLLKYFRVYNFWEQLTTSSGGKPFFVVDRPSAAPAWDNVDQCGINASHSAMIKFSTHKAPGYQLVLATLAAYIKAAPEETRRRWDQDQEIVRRGREHEAENLLGRGASANPRPRSDSRRSNRSTEDGDSDDVSTPYINVHYVVRQRSEIFVGRQRQMDSAMASFGRVRTKVGRRPKVLVIYGLSGSGKTQFCLRFAEENRNRYWGVFWIDCTTDTTAEDSFAALGQLSGKGAEPGAGQLWLSETSNPWLLVLDNANDPEMELRRFIPMSGNGHVFVTTTNPAGQIHNNVGVIRFQGMDPEEAVTLLLKLAYPDESPFQLKEKRALAEKIVSELGYLALALKQAATTIRARFLPLERYLGSLVSCRKLLLGKSIVKNVSDANSISTCELPFTDIESRGTVEYRDAVDLLHIFAFLHFASIPLSIFSFCSSGLKELKHLQIRPAALVEPPSMQMVEDRLLTAARVLYEHSIISIFEAEPSGNDAKLPMRHPKRFFTMHPAIHQWASERLDDETTRKWADCTAAILESSISTNMETSGRPFRRLLLPHIESCLAFLKNAYGDGNFPKTPGQATYLERFALVYAEAGLWKRALPHQLRVVEFRWKHLGRSHPSTLAAQRSLANTYWNLFDLENCLQVQGKMRMTQLCYRPSLLDWFCWPVWKPVSTPYMVTLDELTRSLWLAGNRDLSRQTGERAVAVLTARLGPDDPLTVGAMFNLGRTYLHLGRLAESLELLRHVLARREHFFGPDHPDTLMAVNELGVALCALRDLPAAEALVRRAWEGRRRVLGNDHAYTLWSANDLAKVLCERRRFGEARELLLEVRPVVKRTLGEQHVGMIMTKSNLTRTYVLCGEWEAAGTLIAELKTQVKDTHPDYIHLEWGRAFVLLNHEENFKEAEKCCDWILERVEKTGLLPADNARVLDVAEMLMRIYQADGREDDLKELKRKFPRVGTWGTRRSVDFLPLDKIVRRRTQERMAADSG